MVRAYFPQTFPRTITTNSNYPGQGEELGGATPPPIADGEQHEETLGVFGNVIFDDGTETGNVIVQEV